MTIFLLSFLFLLARIVQLLFCFTEIVSEDMILGVLPKELLKGLKLPFFDYAVTHYHGGTLVYGLFTTPFFFLFGKSVFALRVPAILFQYGSFLIWHLVMRRFFGKREALYASLLYLFSPPYLPLFSMFANGSHPESLFFTALGMLFLYRILYERKTPLKDAAWLGLTLGLGSFFTYGVFLTTAALLLVWLSQEKTLFRQKSCYIFLAFFLIGFSPWLLYNLLYQFHGMDLMQRGSACLTELGSFPRRFLQLALSRILLMLSFNYREGRSYLPHMTLLNWIYYAILAFSYGLLLFVGRKNPKIHFLFLFPLLYLVVSSASCFVIAPFWSPYLLPLFPFFFAAIALGLTHAHRHWKNFRGVSVGILVLLLAMGLRGQWALLSQEEAGLALKYRGYSYVLFMQYLMMRYDHNPTQAAKRLEQLAQGLSEREKLSLYLGASNAIHFEGKPENLQKALSWLNGIPKKYHPLFLKEIGLRWGSLHALSEESGPLLKQIAQEEQPYFLEGVAESLDQHTSQLSAEGILQYCLRQRKGLSMENQRALIFALGRLPWMTSNEESFLDKIERRRELESKLPPQLLPYYDEGLGVLLADCYEPFSEMWPPSIKEALQQMEPSRRKRIYWGAGFEAPLLFEDPYALGAFEEAVPFDFREAFRKGLSDRIAWVGHRFH